MRVFRKTAEGDIGGCKAVIWTESSKELMFQDLRRVYTTDARIRRAVQKALKSTGKVQGKDEFWKLEN